MDIRFRLTPTFGFSAYTVPILEILFHFDCNYTSHQHLWLASSMKLKQFSWILQNVVLYFHSQKLIFVMTTGKKLSWGPAQNVLISLYISQVYVYIHLP